MEHLTTVAVLVIGYILASTASPNPVLPDLSQGFTPWTLVQILLLVASVGGPLYGFYIKTQAARQGAQTIEKNTYDLLTNENNLLRQKVHSMREIEEDFWAVYIVLIKSEKGQKILRELGILEKHPLEPTEPPTTL